jgi:anhydro-N-acetylmuramic acid kinase
MVKHHITLSENKMQFLTNTSPVWAIGLMSGTSLDGVDAALLQTDGERVHAFGHALTVPYPLVFQQKLRALIGGAGDKEAIANELTLFHAEAVARLLIEGGVPNDQVALVGFHGQTIFHDPKHGVTEQIGNPWLLFERAGIPVVSDFRSADVAAGGQGAPLVPVFHASLSESMDKPMLFLNIGGVANITYVGKSGELIACDSGPGNAMLNDWVFNHLGKTHDENGTIAHAGVARMDIVERYLQHPFFAAPAPKSLDRNAFSLEGVQGLDVMTGAATLTRLVAEAVKRSLEQLPSRPAQVLVCGGGRHNPAMMQVLQQVLAPCVVQPVEAHGLNGDALEAQAFAYLAVRSAKGLPISFPTTTGVPRPMCGGTLTPASVT